MATIDKRIQDNGKTVFRARVRLRGYPVESATFDRLTDARKWVQQTEAAMREGRHFKTSESRKRILEDLIDKYLKERLPLRGEDKETVGPQLQWWRQQLGKRLLSDVTPVLIAEQRDRLVNEPINGRKLASATVVRYLASLSVCMTYAIEDLGWLESNPVRQVRKPKPARGRVRFLSPEERERLLTACEQSTNDFLHAVVVLALSTGARMSEITGLTWKDVDAHRKRLVLRDTKNGEDRAVPLAHNAFALLQNLRKVRRIDTDYVFPRKDGLKPMEIRKAWEKAVRAAGLDDFRFHDLRHTAASYLAMNGATLVEISNILGHKSMQMVKRYAHLTEQHTAGILERMNAQQFAASASG